MVTYIIKYKERKGVMVRSRTQTHTIVFSRPLKEIATGMIRKYGLAFPDLLNKPVPLSRTVQEQPGSSIPGESPILYPAAVHLSTDRRGGVR